MIGKWLYFSDTKLVINFIDFKQNLVRSAEANGHSISDR